MNASTPVNSLHVEQLETLSDEALEEEGARRMRAYDDAQRCAGIAGDDVRHYTVELQRRRP